MKLPNLDTAKIVLNSFEETFNLKDEGTLADNNPHRSAYFVNLIGKKLQEHFKGAKAHFQRLDLVDAKNKVGGEWLFDVCVTSQISIKDERPGGSTSAINTNLLFACESEFGTSLSDFTTDFGKLICSNANQYLYIQGLNQFTEKGREDFINSRKEIIQTQLFHLIKDDFVLAFIPTPGKIGKGSFWDTYEEEVLDWASIWIYSASENEFIKYK